MMRIEDLRKKEILIIVRQSLGMKRTMNHQNETKKQQNQKGKKVNVIDYNDIPGMPPMDSDEEENTSMKYQQDDSEEEDLDKLLSREAFKQAMDGNNGKQQQKKKFGSGDMQGIENFKKL